MNKDDQDKLGKTLWDVANELRGSMMADDFRDYMLSFLFLRYLSDSYEQSAQKELGAEYPIITFNSEDKKLQKNSLQVWYEKNTDDVDLFPDFDSFREVNF